MWSDTQLISVLGVFLMGCHCSQLGQWGGWALSSLLWCCLPADSITPPHVNVLLFHEAAGSLAPLHGVVFSTQWPSAGQHRAGNEQGWGCSLLPAKKDKICCSCLQSPDRTVYLLVLIDLKRQYQAIQKEIGGWFWFLLFFQEHELSFLQTVFSHF